MMTKYVAFLRGINVGGHKLIKMADLVRLFESFGFRDVKTYIASGNVLFETAEIEADAITKRIEDGLSKSLGFEVRVILRTVSAIRDLVSQDPFSDMESGKDVRLYVTFFAAEPTSTVELPYESPTHDFRVLKRANREVFSVLFVSPTARSVDAMAFIEREFGKVSTTRNWSTVQKMAAL